MHIQAYSIMSHNNIDFIFFNLASNTFQRNLKRHMFFDYNDVNFNAGLSLLKQYAISENRVMTE